MPGSKSDYLENKVLDDIYGSGTPANHYVGLYTVAPSDAGGGTEVSTDDWTNYARKAVVNNATNWPAAANGQKSNGTEIDHGTAAIVNPPTVVAFATFDALAGNMEHWGLLTTPKTITDGDPVKWPVGALVITED